MTDTTRLVRPYPPGWSMDYGVVGAESNSTALVPFSWDRAGALEAAAEAEAAVGVPMEVCEVDGQWCYRPALQQGDVPDAVRPDMPAEPDEGSAVRDHEGDVWQRRDGSWYMASDDSGESTWPEVVLYGPLHLLVDGPVIT